MRLAETVESVIPVSGHADVVLMHLWRLQTLAQSFAITLGIAMMVCALFREHLRMSQYRRAETK